MAFGEFAESVNERVEPSTAAEEIYVGLDDLDSGSLHIRRWGKGSDVIGTKLRFRKGDIIFGRRRAYQRKLAVAEMDGICSAHAMVVRAKPALVLPEFLPFLMMSDRFMNRAVEISVGSLSPTINWTTLKHEPFALPPLDQQRRIAEILWAVDEVEQTRLKAESSTASYLDAVVEAELGRMFDGPCEKLSELWPESPDSGCSALPSTVETGHFVLSLTALSETGYLPGNLKPVKPTEAMLAARLSKGDFLISRSNTQALVGLVGIYDEERDDVSFPDTMMRLHVHEQKVSKRFLELVLSSTRGRKHMMRSAAGTSGSMKKINRQTLGQCLVPTPSFAKQDKILEQATRIRSALRELESSVTATQALKLAITNSIVT
jgi:type I restriction enzyme S subunit